MISIIIPTLNEEKYLPKLLDSIKNQNFSDYELIVADFNSKDRTREIARRYGCKIVLGGIPGVARNNGSRVAKGEYLLFLDADVILPKHFLYKFVNEFDRKFADIATCGFKYDGNKRIDKLLAVTTTEVLKIFQYF